MEIKDRTIALLIDSDTHKFFSFEDFSKQLAVHLNRYNSFPMRPLGWKSPKHYILDYLSLGLVHN